MNGDLNQHGAVHGDSSREVALLAGGCFWGVEEILRTGTQYRSAIFPHNAEQQQTAERVKARVEASGRWRRPITTTIEPASTWSSAEDYHQDYLQKNPGGYTCHFLRE